MTQEPNVLIASLHIGDVPLPFLTSFDKMQKPTKHAILRVGRGPTHHSRNFVVNQVMQCDDEHLFNAEEADERARNLLAAVTHIFFMDDDMTFPQDALMRLLAHDVPIVSGHYVKRFPPFWPVAMRYVGPTGYTSLIDFCPGLQEVDVVGGGCLLIKREVFETIPYPWFEYVSEEHKGVQTTEDVPFCEKAKKAGFPILLDFDVQCGHLVQIAASHEHWLQFREQMEEDGPPHDPEQLKIRRAAQDVRPYRPDRPKRRSRKSA